MVSVTVRPASAEDVSAIFHVRTSVVESLMTEDELATIGITRDSMTERLESGTAKAWCANIDGDVVGFSLAFREEREVSALFVLPDFERRGFGSMLLEEAVRWLQQLGGDPIRLVKDPDTRAYAFYRKRGWTDLECGPKEDVLEGDTYMEYDPTSICDS